MDKLLYIIKKHIPRKLFKKLQPLYHYLMGWLASVRYGHPSEKLIIIGVIGTTGKTTTAYLIAKMLKHAGYKTGCTSTAMFNDGKKEWLNDKKMTMVGRFFTQKILREMLKNKCQYAVVETTSEGVAQNRHRFINYDVLVFTGLYPEHIESHGSFEKYKEAKGKLFAHLKKCKTKYADEKKYVRPTETNIKKLDLNRVKKITIINSDDENSAYFADFWSEEKIFFTTRQKEIGAEKANSGVRIARYGDISASSIGVDFMINDQRISLSILGKFNAANAMAAFCAGLSQSINESVLIKGLEGVRGIPGRFEKVFLPAREGSVDFSVIVDYAFEPNALAKLYEIIAMIPHNRIIHILGSAGGGRDASRRPLLGKLAGAKSDIVIVANEDPYDENPQIIIDQVAVGAEHSGKKLNENLFKYDDRREAIKKALRLARKGDIVLITGKGCEQAICAANGEKIPWDDREAAREEMRILASS